MKKSKKVTAKTVVATLRKARALIKAGFVKGSLERRADGSGQDPNEGVEGTAKVGYCALGALSHVDGPAERAARVALRLAINPKDPHDDDGDVIMTFNDDNKTKKSDVLRKFKQAEKKAAFAVKRAHDLPKQLTANHKRMLQIDNKIDRLEDERNQLNEEIYRLEDELAR